MGGFHGCRFNLPAFSRHHARFRQNTAGSHRAFLRRSRDDICRFRETHEPGSECAPRRGRRAGRPRRLHRQEQRYVFRGLLRRGQNGRRHVADQLAARWTGGRLHPARFTRTDSICRARIHRHTEKDRWRMPGPEDDHRNRGEGRKLAGFHRMARRQFRHEPRAPPRASQRCAAALYVGNDRPRQRRDADGRQSCQPPGGHGSHRCAMGELVV